MSEQGKSEFTRNLGSAEDKSYNAPFQLPQETIYNALIRNVDSLIAAHKTIRDLYKEISELRAKSLAPVEATGSERDDGTTSNRRQ